MFEQICAEQDLTPSQVVRQLIREYIIEHSGSRPLPHWLLVASKQAGNRRRRVQAVTSPADWLAIDWILAAIATWIGHRRGRHWFGRTASSWWRASCFRSVRW